MCHNREIPIHSPRILILPLVASCSTLRRMSVAEIIREIKAMPKEKRVRVIERICELNDADIPESFKEGMADIRAGRVVDLDEALKDLDEA